jgi:hypothetical protein
METRGFAFAGDLLLRGNDCHSPKVIPQGYTLATLCDRVWILEDKNRHVDESGNSRRREFDVFRSFNGKPQATAIVLDLRYCKNGNRSNAVACGLPLNE